jgi:DNA-binding response OmpR family regulator
MDVGLPDMDGRDAVKQMRQNGFRSPVIMLTAQTSEIDTVMGLDAGANDYVTKPFKFAVLLARIRAQLRQYEASEDAIFQIGPYTFRPGADAALSPIPAARGRDRPSGDVRGGPPLPKPPHAAGSASPTAASAKA